METIDAIIREMRDEVRTSRENNPDPRTRIFLSTSNMALEDFADRIDAAKDEEIERCREELRATRERRDVCETKMRTALERVTRAESRCDSLRSLVKELADAVPYSSPCADCDVDCKYYGDCKVLNRRSLVTRAREEVKDGK